MEEIKEVALKVAREMGSEFPGDTGNPAKSYTFIGEEFAEFASRLLAESQKDAEPVAIEYTPGDWFKAHSIDEMQAFYMSRLEAIRYAAKECGYAIGLHGSTRRDLDLMAMQWRDDCADPDTLAKSIQHAACGMHAATITWEKKRLCGITCRNLHVRLYS